MSKYCIIMSYYDIKIEDVIVESHDEAGYWIVILEYVT